MPYHQMLSIKHLKYFSIYKPEEAYKWQRPALKVSKPPFLLTIIIFVSELIILVI